VDSADSGHFVQGESLRGPLLGAEASHIWILERVSYDDCWIYNMNVRDKSVIYIHASLNMGTNSKAYDLMVVGVISLMKGQFS
jgi:hypothetical protein